MALPTPPEDGHADLGATEARGARPGVAVLWVLVISTVVAVVAVFLVWATFAHRLGNVSQPVVKSPAQAAKFDTPSSQPSPPSKPAVP